MSAIIDECPLCGGAKDLAMEDLRKFVAHIRDCHAAEVNDSRKELLLQIEELKKKPTAVIVPPQTPLMSSEIREMIDRLQQQITGLQGQKAVQYQELMEKVRRADRAASEAEEKLHNANRLISEIKGTMDRWLNDKMPTCCNELLSGLIDAVNDIAPTEKCDSCEFPKGHDCLHCNCPKCCEKGRTEKREGRS